MPMFKRFKRLHEAGTLETLLAMPLLQLLLRKRRSSMKSLHSAQEKLNLFDNIPAIITPVGLNSYSF